MKLDLQLLLKVSPKISLEKALEVQNLFELITERYDCKIDSGYDYIMIEYIKNDIIFSFWYFDDGKMGVYVCDKATEDMSEKYGLNGKNTNKINIAKEKILKMLDI